MESRGISAFELMKEWDTNGDGELDREEFRLAVKRSLKLKASDDQILQLFDLLDVNSDGALQIKSELRPAIHKLHVLYRSELEQNVVVQDELNACTDQIKYIDKCIAAAQKCHDLNAEMMRERPGALSNLEAEIGIRAKALEDAGQTFHEMAQAWGAVQDGWARKDDFVRAGQIISKNKDGWEGLNEISPEAITDIFDQHSDQATVSGATDSPSQGGRTSGSNPSNGQAEPKMSVSNWLKHVSKESSSRTSQERKLATAVDKAVAKARSMQIAYAGEAARKAKYYEIAWRNIEDARQGVVAHGLDVLPKSVGIGTPRSMREERVWGF